MLKTLLVTLTLLFTSTFALAQDCKVTQDAFFAHTQKAGFKVYTLSPSGQEKFKRLINSVRSKNNYPLRSETARFYFASIGPNTSGIVFMDKGCVLEDSVIEIPSAALANVFQAADIKDEEIVEMKDA